MNNKKINWFWAHRRNASLNHFSFLMHGLSGKGWLPSVDFWFDNQLIIGIPKKGCYVFYDKDQLSSFGKFKDIQRSIDENKNFVEDFKKQTDTLFGRIFAQCDVIDESRLEDLSQKDIYKIYSDIVKSLMAAPIITVQLWGIEACLDENYKIVQFLRKKLRELNISKEFQTYKEMLLVNVGETVAFTERKDFLDVAIAIENNKELKEIFKKEKSKKILDSLKNFSEEDLMIEKHIEKYEWLTKEYVSTGWDKIKWIELFKKSILDSKSPRIYKEELLKGFKSTNRERNEMIEKLTPPSDVLHAIDCLAEFIAQRDWAKGYFTKILLSYNKLLFEIARRMNLSQEYIFNISYLEVLDYLKNGKEISKEKILDRIKNGFIILIKGGEINILSGKNRINEIIKEEEIGDFFQKIEAKEFKGIVASSGFVEGVARVVENVSEADKFKEGEILITYMTTIEFIPLFRKAKAVVTDEGGMSSHAAIISREFGLPCIVGTKIATKVLKSGDLVEVDAEKGVVKILNK